MRCICNSSSARHEGARQGRLATPKLIRPFSRRLCIAHHTIGCVYEDLAMFLPSSSAKNSTPWPCSSSSQHVSVQLPRRAVLHSMLAALLLPAAGAAKAEEATVSDLPPSPSTSSPQAGPQDEEYVSSGGDYQLRVPSGWERKGKAGADVLWEDPTRRSTSVGVTVNPVRVRSIEEFGPLETVGGRLLDLEKKKESTLSVAMVAQSTRRLPESNALLYDFEYELDSTRGRKRILNSVTIYDSKLFILNAAYKCDKAKEGAEGSGGSVGGEAGLACVTAPGSLETLRDIAASFRVLPSSSSR